MYRSCIFCTADLGTNEAIEEFPVGSGLAFDAWKGRLWAVCRSCGRWNLAPIEERWEAVETAEKTFRDSRLRVHSENIGLAKLPDGTRLIRVGEALPRELAAWRYGDQLVRRRRQALLWGGAGAVAVATAALGGVALVGAAALSPVVINAGSLLKVVWLARNQHRVLHQVDGPGAPGGEAFKIRLIHMQTAQLVPDPEGEGIAVRVPTLLAQERREDGGVVRWVPPEPILLQGEEAVRLLERTMVRANAAGARKRQLDSAFSRLTETESRDAFLRRLSEREAGLFPTSLFNLQGQQSGPLQVPDVKGAWDRFAGTFRGERVSGYGVPLLTRRLAADEALALEMALHEETERQALEGELAALETAWREAEEIAAIADTLPDDPLEKLKQEELEK